MSGRLYLHGYSEKEQQRLIKQARFMEELVYSDIDLSSVNKLLEIGSGVGAQTAILLERFPPLYITGIDSSPTQLSVANYYLSRQTEFNHRFKFQQMNAEDLDFEKDIFDGVFLCWILEHVNHPALVLKEALRVLKKRGVLIASEVFNATFYTYPEKPHVENFWKQYNLFQQKAGGDPNIGAKLGNLLTSSGFKNIETRVKSFHADNRNPLKKRDTINYWTQLLLSAGPNLIKEGSLNQEQLEAMKKEFEEIADDPEGVFFCSFMQAIAYK